MFSDGLDHLVKVIQHRERWQLGALHGQVYRIVDFARLSELAKAAWKIQSLKLLCWADLKSAITSAFRVFSVIINEADSSVTEHLCALGPTILLYLNSEIVFKKKKNRGSIGGRSVVSAYQLLRKS